MNNTNQFNEVVTADSGTVYMVAALRHANTMVWTLAVLSDSITPKWVHKTATNPRAVTYSGEVFGTVEVIRSTARSWIVDREREAALVANLEHAN